MKPLFEQIYTPSGDHLFNNKENYFEKEFFEKQLNIKLPSQCWRDGSSIYLNTAKDTLLLKYKVINGEFIITYNNMSYVLATRKNYTWMEEVLLNKDRLDNLFETSVQELVDFIKSRPFNPGLNLATLFDPLPEKELFRIGDSSGKDSAVMTLVTLEAFRRLGIKDYTIDFFNSSNEVADTYLHIKKRERDKLNIINPPIGFHNWIVNVKKHYLPSMFVRNCCSTFKEGRLKEFLDPNREYNIFLGVRSLESNNRSHYRLDVNKSVIDSGEKLNVPSNWRRLAPIHNWSNLDVWMYILLYNVDINPLYFKGFNRVGCLICPYQQDLVDVLIKEHFPSQWKRWADILTKSYEVTNVKYRLKWSLDEWINGRWKAQLSKEYYLIFDETMYGKPASLQDRVKELASIKNISTDTAAEFFVQSCTKCGSKNTPDSIALSFKTFTADRSKALCPSCLQELYGISSDDYVSLIKTHSGSCSFF